MYFMVFEKYSNIVVLSTILCSNLNLTIRETTRVTIERIRRDGLYILSKLVILAHKTRLQDVCT